MKTPAKIAVMLMMEDTARADILFTPDRTYYRFATDASIEDGELKAVGDFETLATAISLAIASGKDEKALPRDMKVQVFVDNVLQKFVASEDSMGRIIDIIVPLHAEFAFIQGFRAN